MKGFFAVIIAPMIPEISFQTTVQATIQILLMGFIGYLLVKERIVGDEGLNLLTKLVVNLFLPPFMFYQFTQRFSFYEYSNWWISMVISLLNSPQL